VKRGEVAEELQFSLDLIEQNTADDWRSDALRAVEQVCRQKPDFICDDVWDVGLRSTHNDKALGPVLMTAKRLGYCVKSDRVRPSLRSHLSGKPVWVSQLYRENETRGE
jgi:hypothetical protein